MEKREGLKEVSKAKTKTLSSRQNIAHPRTQTQQHIQETGLAVTQTLYASNPSPAIFKSGPKYFFDFTSKHFSKLFWHQFSTCLRRIV